jgi:hypothetical protein
MEVPPEDADVLRHIDARLTEIEKKKTDRRTDQIKQADLEQEHRELEKEGNDILSKDTADRALLGSVTSFSHR